jgi:secreted trypsin-like serine protease
VFPWIFRKKENEITVRLGEYDFSKTSNTRTDYGVEKITIHENYATKVYLNDIAVIKIKQHAKFNANIQPICLPPTNLLLDDQTAHVTGK